jgi:HCOMODA/2-hydroxy-3-carboxy-muconic semialdehyde decarboxylase
MRGHGATVVASSLKLVVYRAIYTQTNAKILTSLSSLVGGMNSGGIDEVRFLSADESKNAAEANAGQVDRAWNIWVKDVENVAQF